MPAVAELDNPAKSPQQQEQPSVRGLMHVPSTPASTPEDAPSGAAHAGPGTSPKRVSMRNSLTATRVGGQLKRPSRSAREANPRYHQMGWLLASKSATNEGLWSSLASATAPPPPGGRAKRQPRDSLLCAQRTASPGSELGSARSSHSNRSHPGEAIDHEEVLTATLQDLDDTAASLQALDGKLAEVSVARSGSGRRPSKRLHSRARRVIQRKIDLLQKADTFTSALEAEWDHRDMYFSGVLDGSKEMPQYMQGVKKFIASLTHPYSNLIEDSKSDFDRFVTSFKLPGKHKSLDRLRVLSERVSTWWAAQALEEASRGASMEEVGRLVDAAVNAGMARKYPMLAKAVLVAARHTRQRFAGFDTEAWEQGRGPSPPRGLAHAAADMIEEEVEKVQESEGVEQAWFQEATSEAKVLRELETIWTRMAGRRRRSLEPDPDF